MTGPQVRAAGDDALKSRLLLASALFGGAVAFLVFVLFLQTSVVSTARLLFALVLLAVVSLIHYWIATKHLAGKLGAPEAPRLLGLVLLLLAIFFPLLYRTPAYPLSPLLRPWTDLALQFEVPYGSKALALSPDSVKLVMGKDVLNAGAFQLVGPWKTSASQLQLAAGDTGSLRWTGTLPETTVLSIQPASLDASLTVYWDDTRTVVQMHGGQETPIVITQKAPLPRGFNLAFLVSAFIIAAWVLGWIGLALGDRLGLARQLPALQIPAWSVVLLSLVLAALTVKMQLGSLNGGLQFVNGTQLIRHSAVLQGQAPDPWQYRVLSEFVAEGLIRLFQSLAIPSATAVAFISLRLLQNLAIFLAAFALYKKVGGAAVWGLLGILILACSMLNAFYDNDLSFNTYFDLLFYLLCILFLLSRKYWAVVILTVFAALNRETSGLIPFVMAAAIYGDNTRPGLRKYMPAFLSLAIFIGIFAGLRLVYPGRPLYVPYRHDPGIPLLLYNLTRSFTWQQLLTMLGLVPLVGLAFFSSWPTVWQRFFLVVCPIWFLVHSFASIMAETRLFLVPQTIVFIPGVLFALCAWLSARERAATSSLPIELGAS